MCGIFGHIGMNASQYNMEQARCCIDKISHRGPDGIHIKGFNGAHLAHARLSIIDLCERSNQPMSDITGRYWIVYNGEVYNYLDIRKELINNGYSFCTESDTEVILNAYIEWGEDFQNHCNGMWALAIWDDKEKELFLSRDRFGVKPLYYFMQDGDFYFASEMKAFFPVMQERKINQYIFDEKAWFQYEGTEECVIKNIKKIPAGYCGVYKNSKLKILRWWSTLDHLVDLPENYDEQVELLRDLFLDSCRIRMRSDVPIGTALSGGVDSSAVVGAMNYLAKHMKPDIHDDWQHLFTASLPGTQIDETIYAEMAADYIEINLQKVVISGDISPDELLREIYLCEDPYPTSPIPFMQTYGAMRENGIKVTLDGHGADEMFLGYAYDLFSMGKEHLSPEQMDDIVMTYNNIHFPPRKIDRKKYLEEAASYPDDNNLEHNQNWYKLDKANRALYMQTHIKSLPTLFRMYDKYSMSNGVEIRMPFMDYRIVSFAFSIPWTSKVKNGYSKRIVRDIAAPFMTEKIMYRKSKIGFNSPMAEWFRGDMREFVLDIIHSKEFRECKLVNPLDVEVSVEVLLDRKEPSFFDGEKVWSSIMPFLWEKAVIKS